jgi:type I restriction enzyme S subunit
MKNWEKVKLGSLLTESKIVSEKPNTDKRIRVKLYVQGIEKRPDTKDKKGATKYYTRREGQFVYGKQNLHKGAFGIIPKELDGFESSQDIPAFDIHQSCYPEWILYFFVKNNFYLKLETLAKGVGSKRIYPEQIYELDIFLPSKDEQRKILDEIKNTEISNQKLFQEIQLQKENLIKLRQSILDDAVKGKLTQEWRSQNPNIESATKLLEQIKFEKDKISTKIFNLNIKENNNFEIPTNWKYCYLENIIKETHAGKSPQCENRPASINEWGILKTTAIQDLYFLENENKALIDISKINLETEVKHGDLLITRAGPSNRVGISTYVKSPRAKLLLSDKTVRINYYREYIDGEYLAMALSNGISKNYLNSKKTGMALSQVNISQYNMTLTPLLICPIEEQKIIVKKVKSLQSNCDSLEKEILTNRLNSERLMQSIFLNLLGDENNRIENKISIEKIKDSPTRKKKYNSKTTNMDLVKLLEENGKLHAEDLWRMSKHYDDKNINESIDKFYADLKNKVEKDKTIKESLNDKGYIELV